MSSAEQLAMLEKLLHEQLKLNVIDPPIVYIVRGREFVEMFKDSTKVWFRLAWHGRLELIKEIKVDRCDFCTGEYGRYYDLDDGWVKLAEYSDPMIVVILGAREVE